MNKKKAISRLIILAVFAVAVSLAVLLDLIRSDIRGNAIPLYVLTTVSIFTFVLFLTILFLKHLLYFIPHLLIAIGICGYLICASVYASGGMELSTAYSLEGCFIGIGVLAAALSTECKIGKLPLKIPLSVFSAVCTLLDLIRSFINTPSPALVATINLLCVICVSATFIAILITADSNLKAELLVPQTLCCILGFFTIILANENIFLFTPEYTLSILTIAGVASYEFKEVIKSERRNAYLTENMQTEIARQTEELKSIIAERENVMRFISHDMRKPVVTMRKFISVAREREQDAEQIKTIDIIDQKASQLEKNIDEIAKYAKFTYTAEQSELLSVQKILNEVYDELKPDCDANGIKLYAEYSDTTVYAKPTILKSVINNLVINAIEHASCTYIKLRAHKHEHTALITVTDNGVGIDPKTAEHLFIPYETDNFNRTHGLGLYICKTHMESMGGSIEYSSDGKELSFILTLPSL